MTEQTAVRVDPSNVDQLRSWDGTDGVFWATRADRFNEGIAAYTERFFAAAAIEPTDKVLDIGCGSGQTTRDAARLATAGSALGVDLSSPMLELARQLAEREQVTNATFQQADAQVHPFPDEYFDVAISRSGAMFFGDAPAAFTNIARAVRPGGRLALLTWQPLDRNEFVSTFRSILAAGWDLPTPQAGKPGAFALSDAGYVRDLLTSTGFADVRLTAISELMYFGRDVEDAFQFISTQYAGLANGLDAETKADALDRLRASMTEHLTDRGVLYDSASWLIEARRD
jgi:ubiquinone/menaquinone biosynthesis C-methylase UbiE